MYSKIGPTTPAEAADAEMAALGPGAEAAPASPRRAERDPAQAALDAEVAELEATVREVAEKYRDTDAVLMVGAGRMWGAMRLARAVDSVAYVTFTLTGVPGMRAEDLLARLRRRIDDREVTCTESTSRYDASYTLVITVQHARTRSRWNPMLYRYRYVRRAIAAAAVCAAAFVAYEIVYLGAAG